MVESHSPSFPSTSSKKYRGRACGLPSHGRKSSYHRILYVPVARGQDLQQDLRPEWRERYKRLGCGVVAESWAGGLGLGRILGLVERLFWRGDVLLGNDVVDGLWHFLKCNWFYIHTHPITRKHTIYIFCWVGRKRKESLYGENVWKIRGRCS